jgi:cbb3-type cytochrome oxidase subunit 3
MDKKNLSNDLLLEKIVTNSIMNCLRDNWYTFLFLILFSLFLFWRYYENKKKYNTESEYEDSTEEE